MWALSFQARLSLVQWKQHSEQTLPLMYLLKGIQFQHLSKSIDRTYALSQQAVLNLVKKDLFSYIKKLNIFIEPINTVVPRITSGSDIKVVMQHSKATFTLLCPAQAYPVPVYK